MSKKAIVTCICGSVTEVDMLGNNNADGKALCVCGRHITLHLRRNMRPKRWTKGKEGK